ncbi:PREDICTED: hypothetical protein LOC100603494 [Lynx pardinus]|uniref:Uncharacterized protein n=1 Tax=Lynx pardinus TaxID=191816 RepID=A0A485PQG7_LYNPA|nr:PREDICTED: hypothetical protein LOC100603494 [Lynx pardinus]
MRNMQRGRSTNVCLFLQRRGCRPPAQLCRGWGRTFPEREPGLARAPGVHVTPTPTPHFSRELPKPNPAQDGIMWRGMGLNVATPKHIPALPSAIFLPLSWPTSALAPWIPLPGAFQIQQKHFFFFLESRTKSGLRSGGGEGLWEGARGWRGGAAVALRPGEVSELHLPANGS